MSKEFKKLSFLQRKKLTKEELEKYLDDLNEYYFQKRKKTVGENEPIKYIKARKKIYGFLRRLLIAQTSLNRQKVNVLSDERKGTKQPKIYALNHIGKYDIEMAMQAINDHTFVLLGDAKYMYQKIDDVFLSINGVIYLDVYKKEDRHLAKETAIKTLKQGGNVLWCPEGIWNITENQVILPCSYGIIEAALQSKAQIVPVAIEQYDNEFYVKIGPELDVEKYKQLYKDEKELKINAIRDLREHLGTLRWKIWERFSFVTRNEIPDNYYEQFVEERINEWPHFTHDEIEERVFKQPGIVTTKEAFSHLENIEFNSDNAFLLRGHPKIKDLKLSKNK